MNKQQHVRFDWAIKKVLRSKANFGILEGFLSELLRKDIKILELLESEGNQECNNDKFNRVDIMVKDSEEELYIVEIQNSRELDYFHKILYNTSKAITEHMDLGMTYEQGKKVITVSIIYFDIGQGDDYVYRGLTRFHGLHSQDELMLSEPQKKLFNRKSVSDVFPDHYIIRINSFNDIARDTLDEWIYFLKNSEIKDEFKAKGLSEAREKLKEINMTPQERASYNRFIEDLRQELSYVKTIKFEHKYAQEQGFEDGFGKGMEKGMEKGFEKGIEKGIEKGFEKGIEKGIEKGFEKGALEKAKDIARNLKALGASVDMIQNATGLDPESIRNL